MLWGLAVNAATTSISLCLGPHVQLAHLMILHLLGAVLISTRFGPVASTVTAITSVLAFDYFCIPPIFAFALPDRHSVVTFVGMLVTALAISFLIQRLRFQRSAALSSEARTLALCELSLDLSHAARASDLPGKAERHIEELFDARAEVFLCDERGALDLSALRIRERNQVVASLEAPAKSEVWEIEDAVYQRVGGDETLGVIRIFPADAALGPRSERSLLLAACADRIGVAVERLHLSDAARRAQVEAETERLRNALLSSVSHDLRTPLASILTAGTTLLRDEALAQHDWKALLETIVQETERLNALVTNLLSVTRLESGDVRVEKTPEALDDLVHGVLSRLSLRLEGRDVEVELEQNLPLVSIDSALVDQVLVNLIENVLAYTPAGSPVGVRAMQRDGEVVLEVLDRGPGVASDETDKVFEKFYRGRQGRRQHGGTGLGLTICRAVARVHGGRISLSGRPGGGTRVEFVLPCPHPVESLVPAREGHRQGATA